MGAKASRAVNVAKRAFFCVVLLLLLGVIGGLCALKATNPNIPHPWGQIRLMQYSTNGTSTLAHFRFRNLFDWPVFMEVGLEVRRAYGWEMARGYSMFVPIEKPVAPHNGQDFSVPVPFDCKEWRVLIRAAKAQPTETDLRRGKIKGWLATHGAGFLAERIEVDAPSGHILPGPEMRWDKPGRLPTAH